MANYNIVIDTSHFKPFDISPAMQVLHDYRDAYYRLEDLMNKIAEEKGEYVLPESSKYKGVMDRYNADYDAAVSDFSKGMNLLNALAIRNLRRRYSSEITPIRTMVQNYNKYNDKLTALGSDAIVGNVYGVDDFYGGVTPAIDYRSAKLVELDAMKYFSGINNALTQDPEFKNILGNQYYLQTQKGGLNSGDALQAALVEYNNRTNGRHSEAVQNLINHMQNVMNAQSVDNFSDTAKNQVWNKIASGLIASIEAPKFSHLGNLNFESDATRLTREAQIRHYDDLHDAAVEELNLGRAQAEASGYIRNPDGTYTYDPNKVLVTPNPRSSNGSRTQTPATPHLEYNGHNYIIKIQSNGDEDPIYIISDMDSGAYVTDPTLKRELIDKYERGITGTIGNSPSVPRNTYNRDQDNPTDDTSGSGGIGNTDFLN